MKTWVTLFRPFERKTVHSFVCLNSILRYTFSSVRLRRHYPVYHKNDKARLSCVSVDVRWPIAASCWLVWSISFCILFFLHISRVRVRFYLSTNSQQSLVAYNHLQLGKYSVNNIYKLWIKNIFKLEHCVNRAELYSLTQSFVLPSKLK